jgi:hypothetical protein
MNIEQEIRAIKARNEKVEQDKKWETSWTRRVVILVLTFAVVLVYNLAIQSDFNIFLSSLVPVIGFFLSTLSLGVIRKVWEKRSGK